MVEHTARCEAQKLWNSNACGELMGDKHNVVYFLGVEKDRYEQQPWAKDYFEYESFSRQKVLEIGVGQGTDLMQFSRGGAECFGVDITRNHLTLTQRNFDLQKKKVNLYESDACTLPFPDNYFDCVYSFGVMHHIPEIEKVISEVKRVLKPGGKLMIALYYKWSAFHLFSKLLLDGVGRGWLFSKGYKGLLATIETQADGVSVKPYVRLYSRKSCKKILSPLSVTDISVHQLYPEHFYPKPLQKLVKKLTPLLEPKLGWYVAAKAVKK